MGMKVSESRKYGTGGGEGQGLLWSGCMWQDIIIDIHELVRSLPHGEQVEIMIEIKDLGLYWIFNYWWGAYSFISVFKVHHPPQKKTDNEKRIDFLNAECVHFTKRRTLLCEHSLWH